MHLKTVLKRLLIIYFVSYTFSHINTLDTKYITDCWLNECVVNFVEGSTYVFQTRSKADKVRISVNLSPDFSFPNPPNCSTDYLKVEVNESTGNVKKTSHVYTLCEGRGPLRRLVEVQGKEIIVKFKYRHDKKIQSFINLLIITARFIESIPSIHSVQTMNEIDKKESWTWAAVYNTTFFQNKSIIVYNQTLLPLTFHSSPVLLNVGCNYTFDGNIIQTANFRWPTAVVLAHPCSIQFHGKKDDFLHVTVTSSWFSVQNFSNGVKAWEKEKSRDSWSKLSTSNRSIFVSSKSLKFAISASFIRNNSTEFLEGFFRFFNEKTDGFINYNYGNKVAFKETRVLQSGQLLAPPHQPDGERNEIHSTVFIPENRTILLSFQRADTYIAYLNLYQRQPFCYTRCEISSCHCETQERILLQNIDHVLVMIKSTQVACLCGFFPSLMPIRLESSSPLAIEYHFTGKISELTFSANYRFQEMTICRNFSFTQRLGVMGPGELFNSRQETLPHLTFFQCSWQIIPMQLDRIHLIIVSEEEAQIPCTLWNITVEIQVPELNLTTDALTSKLPRLNLQVRYIRLNIEEEDLPCVDKEVWGEFIDPDDIFPYGSVIVISIFIVMLVAVLWGCQVQFF